MITWAIVYTVVSLGGAEEGIGIILLAAMVSDVTIFYFISKIGKKEPK